MSEVGIGVIALVVLLAFFMTGIELAFAMGIIGVVGFAYVVNVKAAMGLMANDFFDALASYGLTVIPLFVLMGQIAFNAGIAKRLYDCAHKFLGHIPGGMAIATVAGATAFKAICGSVAATSATFASVAVPEMTKFGYHKKLSTGIVATVGTLGVLIPPSVVLIVFGIITQLSIGRLFLAGIIPGLLIAFFFVVVIFGWCKINPSLGPKSDKFTWGERAKTLPDVIWPIVIFFVIIIGLMQGVFTPTEAGSIGAFAVLLLCLLKRNINFKGYIKSVQESLRTACMVLLLIATSNILGHFIAVTNIPNYMGEWVLGLKMPAALIMVLCFLVYLLGGSFIDDMAFMILATPIFFPIMTKLGYDPLLVGIIVALTVCIGSVIPPVAICVFIVRNITKVPMGVIYSGVYPFLISLVLVVILTFLFPQIVLFLPNWLMP
ncbi:MAG: Sialic acid TRAP transporter permease protein SiaT [Syntrophorhabdaceae bacterium PtaU1.Bin034]|jgi:tripartite ATP-independent transporter DctM subunit|nr:MAG: Sialic acid TRAP transporter permease protein SiaT [Syntrophorhabdaceae bacterium PtaU1.Bin034]